jgi:hypothetical protein
VLLGRDAREDAERSFGLRARAGLPIEDDGTETGQRAERRGGTRRDEDARQSEDVFVPDVGGAELVEAARRTRERGGDGDLGAGHATIEREARVAAETKRQLLLDVETEAGRHGDAREIEALLYRVPGIDDRRRHLPLDRATPTTHAIVERAHGERRDERRRG